MRTHWLLGLALVPALGCTEAGPKVVLQVNGPPPERVVPVRRPFPGILLVGPVIRPRRLRFVDASAKDGPRGAPVRRRLVGRAALPAGHIPAKGATRS